MAGICSKTKGWRGIFDPVRSRVVLFYLYPGAKLPSTSQRGLVRNLIATLAYYWLGVSNEEACSTALADITCKVSFASPF